MFDLGWSKLVLIAIVALIVIGPKELPAVLRTVGQWMAKIRRMAAEFQTQFQEAMREAEMAELKQHIDQIHDAAKGLTAAFNPTSFNPLETARSEIERALEGSSSASAASTEPSGARVGGPVAGEMPASDAAVASPPVPGGKTTPAAVSNSEPTAPAAEREPAEAARPASAEPEKGRAEGAA
jgi:sec-independent protein translocase protein TatB